MSFSSKAQNRHDFGIWAGLKIDQKLYKNLSFSLRGQVRLRGNAQYFRNTFINASFNYKFHKIFTLTAGYRYSVRNNGNNHRAYADAKFNFKIKPIRTIIKLRLRGQYNTSVQVNELASTILRPRLYVGYNLPGKFAKRFNIYMTGEIFYELYGSFQELNRYRLSAGITYDVSDDIELNVRYIFQDDIGIPEPLADHILYMMLSVDLPDFKKKKKK